MRIAAGESLDELTCGLSVVLPVDDGLDEVGLDEVGGLVDGDELRVG